MTKPYRYSKEPPLPPEIAAMTNVDELHRLEQQTQFELQNLAAKRDAISDQVERLINYKIAINRRLIELLEAEFMPAPDDKKEKGDD